MRIIGGSLGGRRFQPPGKMPHTRPTTDVAKEGLFNIIENNLDIPELDTLDLFGGTGSISYELASRGARSLTIVEKDNVMADFIRKSLAAFHIEQAEVIRMDVFRYIEQSGRAFPFIFAGPPYALTRIDDLPAAIFDHRMLSPGGWFVLEHTPRNNYASFPAFAQERKYGTTVFSIFLNR